MIHIFIAVTYDKVLTAQDLEHYLDIAEGIDGLLFRTSMPQKELKQSMIHLMNQGFAKEKIIVHSDIALLEDLNLKRIHFKENDETAFSYKKAHPDIQVSMSTHNAKSVRQCIDSGLDYVFFGHIFPTTSHPNELPRTNDEIEKVLNLPIPIYAIGGISQQTIAQVSQRFAGICAISFFMNASLEDIKELKRKWLKHA